MDNIRAPDVKDQAKKDYLKGMKYKDLAEKYGVSINTIKSWKQRYEWDRKSVHTKEKVCTQKKTKKNEVKKESNAVQVVDAETYELTEKQQLFAEIYVRNFNATQAAIKAGYAPGSAFVEGSRLLRNVKVKAYINYLKELKKESIMLTEDDIVERYMRIAFADMTDFVMFGQKDVPIMTPEGPAYIVNPETNQKVMLTQRVNTLSFKEDYEIDGGLICEIKTSKQGASIKLEDRQKALDWLANYFEMNPEHKLKKMHDERKLQLERERFEHQKKLDESKVW